MTSLLRCLPILLVTTLATAGTRALAITGVYESNWDEVRLVQDGSHVHGSYVCCGGGVIEGRITEGRLLRYTWKQPGAEGRGVWKIRPGRLEGTWGYGDSDSDGGRWDLVAANARSSSASSR